MDEYLPVKEMCKFFEQPSGNLIPPCPSSIMKATPAKQRSLTVRWCLVIAIISLAICVSWFIYEQTQCSWNQIWHWSFEKIFQVSEYITERDNGTTIDVNRTLNQIVYSFASWKSMCLVGVSMLVILIFIIFFIYAVVATIKVCYGTALVSLALAFLSTAINGYTTWLGANKTLTKMWLVTSFIMLILGLTWIAVQFVKVLSCRNSKAAIGYIKAAIKSIRFSTVMFSLGVGGLQILVVAFCGMVALCMASVGKVYLSGLPVFLMLWISFIVSAFSSMMLAYITHPQNAAPALGTAFRLIVWDHLITVASGGLVATIIFVLKTLWKIIDWMMLKKIGFSILFGLYTLWSVTRLCPGKCGKTVDAYLQLYNFENAYIVRITTDKSFIASAKYACKLHRKSSLQDTDVLFHLLKLTPTCAVALLGYALFSWQQIVPIIFAALFTYFITAKLLHPFEVVVKTAEFAKRKLPS